MNCKLLIWAVVGAVFGFPGGLLRAQDQPLPDPLINFDPAGLVRFDSIDGAEARRKLLVNFVWAKGLPLKVIPDAQVRDRNVFGKQLSGIDPQQASEVLELRCRMNPFGFEATCFLIRSNVNSPNNRRLLIVHSGHRNGKEIAEGVDRMVETGLARGFQVLVVDMPLVGWNQDRTLTLPRNGTKPEKEIRISNRGTGGHNEMFRQLADPVLPNGTVFRFFAEPVVQGINYFQSQTAESQDVTMVGLSGGGWATHFCAAVDTRIKNSFPVAGAMPLYARRFSRGSWGDTEQTYAPLYGEKDTNGDGVGDQATGVSSWLEIFALGGIGTQRQQLQILNFKDPCCFSTEVYRTYNRFLQAKVKRMGKGSWSLFSDRTHDRHIISESAIQRIMKSIVAE